MILNCWIYAKFEFYRRTIIWLKDGRPQDRIPHFDRRWSKSDPWWIPHFSVGERDPDSGMVELESFKPDNPTSVPWYLAWTHLLFRGRVVRGD